METRIINGRPATDRDGAAELGGISRKTIDRRASPKYRDQYHFPAPLDTQDRRAWYPIDGDDGLKAHFRAMQEQHEAATAAGTRTPDGAPASILAGDPDDELSATEFYRAANITQGAWKYYVQKSKKDWDAGRDGYLPIPNDEELAPNGHKIYYFTRRRIIDWLNNRTGRGTGAGRKGGAQPRIADAADAIRANPTISGTQLAHTLNISLDGALYLLRRAREQLAAEAQ